MSRGIVIDNKSIVPLRSYGRIARLALEVKLSRKRLALTLGDFQIRLTQISPHTCIISARFFSTASSTFVSYVLVKS